MMRVALATVLGLLLSTDPCVVDAAEPIRVLIGQEILRAEVSSTGRLIVRSGADEEATGEPVVLSAAASGGVEVHVNGRRLASSRVTISGGPADLLVKIGEGPSMPVGGTVQALVLGASQGTSQGQRPGQAKGLALVNRVELEEYVKGVVPSEMNAAWHPEALKAQAVVARTYVLYQQGLNRDRDYDVAATTADQVYRGRQGLDGRVQAAVETTRGLVLVYERTPILAAFSSTAAGPTEDALVVWSKDLPYLKGVDCPFDANSPYYQWRAEFALQDLEDALRRQGMAVGTIATVTPLSYSRAGRVAKLRILHSRGELILRGEDLRRAVGYTVVPSTQFEIESIGRTVVLAGRGAGHAVGLCQWGAKEMADSGYGFDVILRYYYPGAELSPLALVNGPARP